MKTPMTIKELKERLDFLLKEGHANEEDYVFYHLPEEDEGSYRSLVPVNTISSPSIKFFNEEKHILDKLIKKEGIILCFISPTIINDK